VDPFQQQPHLDFSGVDSPPHNYQKQYKMSTKRIEGIDVLDVRALPGLFDYNKESQMAGKKYRRFAYGGDVFIADAEDPFCQELDNDNLFSITFGVNDEAQLSMTGFVTLSRYEKMKGFESRIKKLDIVNVVTNPEELASL